MLCPDPNIIFETIYWKLLYRYLLDDIRNKQIKDLPHSSEARVY